MRLPLSPPQARPMNFTLRRKGRVLTTPPALYGQRANRGLVGTVESRILQDRRLVGAEAMRKAGLPGTALAARYEFVFIVGRTNESGYHHLFTRI